MKNENIIHIVTFYATEKEILKLKLKNLETRTNKLEKINKILYDMIKKQDIQINTQNNLNEIERLNQRFFLKKLEPQIQNNNQNLPLIQKNKINQNSYINDPPPYRYNYQPNYALPYINEIERMINTYKMENEGYRKMRENENNIMRRIDEKINDFLLEETLKKNDNTYLRHQIKEMNDQLNFRLETIEHNQRVQRQKIDYIMQNYYRHEKNNYKSHYKHSKDENDINNYKSRYKHSHNDNDNDINNGNVNKSCINISHKYKKENYYDKDDENNRIYPYENSKRIFYKKIENGGNSKKSSLK